MNNDGTIYDKHKGIPKITEKIRKWLEGYNWEWKIKQQQTIKQLSKNN